MSLSPKPRNWFARHRHSTVVRYGGALLAVWVALSLWTFSPILHRNPSTLYLAAVLLTGRYLGFGPAVFGSLLSAACLDFFVFPPVLSFSLSQSPDIERLIVFLAISVLAGSMARQRTLAELRAERVAHEMAAIVESSRDAILSTDADGVIASWNRAAEHLYGYSAEEALGMPVTVLAPPERRDEVENNLRALRAGQHIAPYQTERISKNGTRWPALLSISPLLDRRGQFVGISAIARDISAEKQSELALRQREKLATAGRLAASIAHEINNPLEAVVNLLYLAREDRANSTAHLAMAEQEVGRIARLAQQTLGFVRDSNGSGSVDPAAIMDEVLQLYSHKLHARRIHVERRYRGTGSIHANSGQLRQLFSNLIVNAADAMPKDGRLHVRVAPSHDWGDNREGIRVTIADNGAGIPSDTLPRVFEPFYTTKVESGTGLGLWISSGIVREHGGTINVRSRIAGPARGTVFSIFLPHQYEAIRVA